VELEVISVNLLDGVDVPIPRLPSIIKLPNAGSGLGEAPTYIERDCMLSNLLAILYYFHKFKGNSCV
jgi:hypothetical protein